MPIVPGASLAKRRIPVVQEKTGAGKQVQRSSSSAVTTSASASASSLTPSSLLPSSSSASRQAPKKNTSSLSSATPPSSTASDGGRQWTEDVKGMKGGKYSNTESKIVVDAIKSYASANAITVESLCQDGSRSVGSKRAWLSIANCLPDRSVQSIYRHGIRQLHGMKMGPWTDEEVAQLKLLVSTHGNKWSEIGKKVGRSADACRDKSRELIPTPQEGPWTEQEEKLLNKLIMDRMECSEDMSEVMLTGDEDVDVPWAEVARIIKSRNRIACRKKWDYLQMQRRQKRQYVRDTSGSAASVNLAFVKAIIDTGAADESELNWSSLPYPRANLKWKNLRERELQAPNANLQFREALIAVRGRLQRKFADEKKTMDQRAEAAPISAAVAAPTVASPLSAGSGGENDSTKQSKERKKRRKKAGGQRGQGEDRKTGKMKREMVRCEAQQDDSKSVEPCENNGKEKKRRKMKREKEGEREPSPRVDGSSEKKHKKKKKKSVKRK
ncbi:MYB [Ectocarpus sp. CCAP 1310/34]|nr:MYB [Ectocarpus sp. CCAP 1310/34]